MKNRMTLLAILISVLGCAHIDRYVREKPADLLIFEAADPLEKIFIETLVPDHPILAGIRWETCPVFTGYNRIKAKEGAQVLARVKEFVDPFLVTHTFGKGRSMAFASDVSPHWGAGFQRWENYGKFFIQALRWLAGK